MLVRYAVEQTKASGPRHRQASLIGWQSGELVAIMHCEAGQSFGSVAESETE